MDLTCSNFLAAEVRDLLRDLRAWLRDATEPPVAVSDRRLRKAAALLRVAAATCGRDAVCVADALLLEHVLWERGAEQAANVRHRVIQAAARRLRQAPGAMAALLEGLECRALRAGRTARESVRLAQEAAALQRALLGELAEADLGPLRTLRAGWGVFQGAVLRWLELQTSFGAADSLIGKLTGVDSRGNRRRRFMRSRACF